MTAHAALAAALGLGALVPAAVGGCDVSARRGRVEATAVSTRAVPLDGRELILDGFAGRVRLREAAPAPGEAADGRARLRLTRRARGATRASAAARLADVVVEDASDGDLVQVVWRTALAGGARVDADVVLPAGARVVVRLRRGSLDAAGVTGSLDAAVEAGSLTVARTSARRLTLRTGRGPLRVGAAAVPAGAVWTAETGHGPLALRLPPGAGVALDARSATGRVEVREPGAPGRTAAGRVRTRLGDGRAAVTLRSRTGDVAVRVGAR